VFECNVKFYKIRPKKQDFFNPLLKKSFYLERNDFLLSLRNIIFNKSIQIFDFL